MSALFRLLPSVDKLLATAAADPDLAAAIRPLVKDIANDFLDRLRTEIREGIVHEPEELQYERVASRFVAFARAKARPHFRRVLNATGVVIHTNLGRSNLAESAVQAVTEACRHYSNLEFDLEKGARGSRYSHVEELLCRITGAEAGLMVNNNASAVLICLDTLAKGRETVISRGQLIEIGGSFRIPEVMEKSGSILREVGATNRTHLRDYENAIGENTGLLLKVHTSNYRMIGFTKEVPLDELVELGRRHDLPVMEDLGSGCFLDMRPYGLGYEPTVQEAVASGADVVTFSGDKVLGGPQAGLIVGRRDVIARIKKNPLNRAIRIDKMTLAAMEATLRLYLEPERAKAEIPTLRMLCARPDELARQARRLAGYVRRAVGEKARVELRPGFSQVGGGSFPEVNLRTTLVALSPTDGSWSVEGLRERLLDTDPPLVGRVEEGAFCLDPRTLTADEHPLAAKVLASALKE